MATIVELMKPYLQAIHPGGTEYSGDGNTKLIVTLPKLERMAYRKTQTLVFESMVVDAVREAEAAGNSAVIDHVGNYICNVLSERFHYWDESNVQIPRFHVGDKALDE